MKQSLIIGVLVAALAMPAFALDLHGARTQGLVGEKPDGYVAAVTPSPEVNALVSQVNAKRRTEYARISKENGQSPEVVAKLAAPQILQNLEPGSSYQDASGAWKKR